MSSAFSSSYRVTLGLLELTVRSEEGVKSDAADGTPDEGTYNEVAVEEGAVWPEPEPQRCSVPWPAAPDALLDERRVDGLV